MIYILSYGHDDGNLDLFSYFKALNGDIGDVIFWFISELIDTAAVYEWNVEYDPNSKDLCIGIFKG